jgi:acyl carrier protein
MDFPGREDDQLKKRDYHLELDEIEAKLRNHALIEEVVVISYQMQSQRSEPLLVAYVVLCNADSMTVDDLHSFAKDILPTSMVPTAYMIIDEMPLLPSGKIDRSALPEPVISLKMQKKDYVAPRTPTEKVLTQIMREVLGVELVGVTDDFFELGGHSLSVTQVISRISSELHVNLTMKTLFEVSTIEDLSRIVDFLINQN